MGLPCGSSLSPLHLCPCSPPLALASAPDVTLRHHGHVCTPLGSPPLLCRPMLAADSTFCSRPNPTLACPTDFDARCSPAAPTNSLNIYTRCFVRGRRAGYWAILVNRTSSRGTRHGEEEGNNQSIVYSALRAVLGVSTCGHGAEQGLGANLEQGDRQGGRSSISLLKIVP